MVGLSVAPMVARACLGASEPMLLHQDDIDARIKLFDYLRSLGQACGSEGSADWAAPALHYQEGSLTLTRIGGIPGIYVGTAPLRT